MKNRCYNQKNKEYHRYGGRGIVVCKRWLKFENFYEDVSRLPHFNEKGYSLDRIDNVEPLPEKKYIKCTEDLYERFEDIVGVTLYENCSVEHILCWVSEASKGYIETKPIHGSYTPIRGDADLLLRSEYPQLQGGLFFTLDCKSLSALRSEIMLLISASALA